MKINLVQNIINFDIELIFLKNFNLIDEKLLKIFKNFNFQAKENNSLLLINEKKIYIGTYGLKGEDIKIAASNAIKELKKYNFTKIKISLNQNNKDIKITHLVEGLLLGEYHFQKYKSKKEKPNLNILIDLKNSKKDILKLKRKIAKVKTICRSVNKARTIVNTTPEEYTPIKMASDAKKIALKNKLEYKIYGLNYFHKKKMNGIIAVGKASRHESRLIHLIYRPKNPKGKIVLVGKGLTYDCGGLSLKSSKGMISMKCDKSGAASVLGVMNSLRDLNYDYEVHGVIGAVENMIGGNAYKPDDIITIRNNVSIEVKSTDAEGRIVLADCLCYAQDKIKNIDYIFDLATLTGACIVGLGEYTIGVMGHNKILKKKIKKSANKAGELVGFLPYNRYLPNLIKSSIANIVNSTSSKAGAAITASLFLDNFIKKENKKKWLHFDIAGASYKEKSWGYNPYGATGAGIRMILKFIKKEQT